MKPAILFIIFIISTLIGCNFSESNQSEDEHALFKLHSPDDTHIYFENALHETDTFNSIFYEYYYNGAGLAIGDINNDGLSDIFFGGNMEKSRLYLNKGNFRFQDITESSGINTLGSWVTGINLIDLNQDGWLDIYLCVGGNIIDDYRNLLYINNGASGELTFTEQAEIVGLNDDGYSTQAAFFDYDRDGDLDVYILTSSMDIPNKNSIRGPISDGSMKNTDRLYKNDGFDPKTKMPVFHNVSKEAGITWDGFGLGICISDINQDGWPDVYIANDYISNDLLYINQGNGKFKECAQLYFKHTSYSAMGMDIADINNDALVDIFTLDMLPEDYFRKRIMAGNMRIYRRYQAELEKGYSRQYIRNMLQLNNGVTSGDMSFSEIGQLSGVFETDWSWAPLFADFDNDGYRDLFIGNGIPQDLSNMDFSTVVQNQRRTDPDMPFSILGNILRDELLKLGNVKKPNVIYHNKGNLLFEDKSAAWGMKKPSYSTGASYSDLDNDGDLDLVLNNIDDPAFIYENKLIDKQGPDSISHYIKIRLSGSQNNKSGLGAKIWLYSKNTLQYHENYPVRGFQSMIDPLIHFGLGAVSEIDSLIVWWPDGKEQILYNINSDQVLKVKHNEAKQAEKTEKNEEVKKCFKEVSDQKSIVFYHKEKDFVDFNIQPLLPHMYSKEGPGIGVGDVNSDGLDDFYIGGATGSFGTFFIQQKNGSFTSFQLPDNPNYEDMGALFFDTDGDGDDDLYVVSGGTGLPPGNPFYSDRLYVNNGDGTFSPAKKALPETGVCGSSVSASDFDKDGDLDLFICGRIKLENYPFPEKSFLLRNDSKGPDAIRFTDITLEAGEDLQYAGLVSSALWTDYDLDGWTDLILAGEWMPLTVFRNEEGQFVNKTSSLGLSDFTGWWNSIVGADFDKDGDIDYVAGNHGLNTRFKVSQDQPMRIVAKDFDKNGYIDPVCSYYVQGKRYPIYHRNLMIDQMPFIKVKYSTYEDYAKATMEDIFSEDQISDAFQADCRIFNTVYIENLEGKSFRIHPLPIEAQFAPVFGLLANDYNGDGNCDILLAGNSYSSNVDDGQYDASIGLLLQGDGTGEFSPVPGRSSGFFVDGDAKGMAELINGEGRPLILVAQNSGKMKVFETACSDGETIRLKKEDASAIIQYNQGTEERREFYYGSGYLSNSSRVCRVSGGVNLIKITSYTGETRTIEFD